MKMRNQLKNIKEREGLKEKGEIKKRYGWLTIFTLVVWGLILLMIFFVNPDNLKDLIIKGSYLLPGLLIYLGIFLFLAILTLSSKRALVWATVIMLGLYLRLWGLGSLVNLSLLLGMVLSIEIYRWQNKG